MVKFIMSLMLLALPAMGWASTCSRYALDSCIRAENILDGTMSAGVSGSGTGQTTTAQGVAIKYEVTAGSAAFGYSGVYRSTIDVNGNHTQAGALAIGSRSFVPGVQDGLVVIKSTSTDADAKVLNVQDNTGASIVTVKKSGALTGSAAILGTTAVGLVGDCQILPAKTKAELLADTPVAVCEIRFCSNCATTAVSVSTDTTPGGVADFADRTKEVQ